MEDPRLRLVHGSGRAAWPGIALPAEVFACYLAARTSAQDEIDRVFDHVPDLYLACACAQGDAAAIAAFDDAYLTPIAAMVARVDAAPAFIDEVSQLVRVKLFVSDGQAPPKIAEYRGRGDLLSWVRTVALRTALNARQSGGREVLGRQDDLVALAIDCGQDMEAAYLKGRFQQAFMQALKDALQALCCEQRNLLRLSLVDGLGVEKLGVLFHVAPSTISRRLAGAREELARETRRLLKERLRLTSGEFESIAGLVRSQLELSLTGML